MSVTVPVLGCPADTVAGFSKTFPTVAGVIVRDAVTGVPFAVAVIVALAMLSTEGVVTLKLAEVAPLATVTEAGTTADLEVDASVTTTPEEGAGPFSEIVPTDGLPPTTEDGASVSPTATGGRIVTVADDCTVPKLAVKVAGVDTATAPV